MREVSRPEGSWQADRRPVRKRSRGARDGRVLGVSMVFASGLSPCLVGASPWPAPAPDRHRTYRRAQTATAVTVSFRASASTGRRRRVHDRAASLAVSDPSHVAPPASAGQVRPPAIGRPGGRCQPSCKEFAGSPAAARDGPSNVQAAVQARCPAPVVRDGRHHAHVQLIAARQGDLRRLRPVDNEARLDLLRSPPPEAPRPDARNDHDGA